MRFCLKTWALLNHSHVKSREHYAAIENFTLTPKKFFKGHLYLKLGGKQIIIKQLAEQ
jgi:hypothetical protein